MPDLNTFSESKNTTGKTYEAKIIRDPIHGFIEVSEPIIQDLIDSKAFQRLRRIKQLGLVPGIYPGAEHTRFAHSLGTYHVAKRIIASLKQKKQFLELIEEHALTIKCAALCHDLGHGPYSHVFEPSVEASGAKKLYSNHEFWTCEILKNDPELRLIFETSGNHKLNQMVRLAITGDHPIPFVNQIIASQLDADRIDFVLRDSYMTGSKYGEFDCDWLIHHLELCKKSETETIQLKEESIFLVFDATRGYSVLSQFLRARQNMYKHVYLHKFVRCQDTHLKAIILRYYHLAREGFIQASETYGYTEEYDTPLGLDFKISRPFLSSGKAFENLLMGKSVGVEEYMSFDDSWLLGAIKTWSELDGDSILKTLCTEFLNRTSFKAINYSEGQLDILFDHLPKAVKTSSSESPPLNCLPYFISKDRREHKVYNYLLYDQSNENKLIYTINKKNRQLRPYPLHPENAQSLTDSYQPTTLLIFNQNIFDDQQLRNILKNYG